MTLLGIGGLFATLLALSAVPGPIDFAVVGRAIGSGFRSAMVMVAGILVADGLFILAAVYGLASIAEDSQGLFDAALWASVAILLWLGVSILVQGDKPDSAAVSGESAGSRYSSFIAGLLLTLGDPKAILFYMALLPAFVDLQSLTLFDIFIILISALLAVTTVKVSYAYAAIRLGRSLSNRPGFVWLHRIAGGLLIVTAILLASRLLLGVAT